MLAAYFPNLVQRRFLAMIWKNCGCSAGPGCMVKTYGHVPMKKRVIVVLQLFRQLLQFGNCIHTEIIYYAIELIYYVIDAKPCFSFVDEKKLKNEYLGSQI